MKWIQEKKQNQLLHSGHSLTVEANAIEAVKAGLTRVRLSPPSGQTCPPGCCHWAWRCRGSSRGWRWDDCWVFACLGPLLRLLENTHSKLISLHFLVGTLQQGWKKAQSHAFHMEILSICFCGKYEWDYSFIWNKKNPNSKCTYLPFLELTAHNFSCLLNLFSYQRCIIT